MTDRRGFFGALAALFAGFTATSSSSSCLSNVSTSYASSGKTVEHDRRITDHHPGGLGIAERRLSSIRMVGGEWAGCPSLGDKSNDGFFVVGVSRSYACYADGIRYAMEEWKFIDPSFDPKRKELQ